eukprot:scaffold7017_cov134-Cylindrotheca_fusiformis.AAC.10
MDPTEESNEHGDIEDECCRICYETFAKQEELDVEAAETCFRNSKEPFQINGCDHRFCRGCLTVHCNYAIVCRETPICCPASASDKCETYLSEEQIQNLLDCSKDAAEEGSIPSDWTRYQRLEKLRKDPSLISCSRCLEVLSKDDNTAEVTCNSCGHTFCSVHGDAHPGRSCKDYKNDKPNRQMKMSEKMIKVLTKPCSHCAAPIEKESGCDHVICVSCNEDMCYRCGTHIHLRGDGMIRSCNNCEQSFVDHRYIWSYRLAFCLSLPLGIAFCVFYTCVVGATAILSLGCFCCFCCGADDDPDGDGETSYSFRRGLERLLILVFLPTLAIFRDCGIDVGSQEFEKYFFVRPPSTEKDRLEATMNKNDSESEDALSV